MSMPRQIAGLAGWALLCFATATIGAIASVEASSFYAQLSRPAWAPPASWFAPVWTTLYAMMAVAAWLVWRTPAVRAKALTLFIIQLAVNALWSWIFFAWHQGAIAFVEVILLWCLIVATVISFWRISKPAAVMLCPYLAWVTFASALTYSTWQLNPELL